MIQKLLMAAGMAALVAAAPVSAEDKDKDAPKEKKICRTEKVTGSLTRVRRICMTEAEWKELNDRTRNDVDEIQSGASGSQCIPNDPMAGGRC